MSSAPPPPPPIQVREIFPIQMFNKNGNVTDFGPHVLPVEAEEVETKVPKDVVATSSSSEVTPTSEPSSEPNEDQETFPLELPEPEMESIPPKLQAPPAPTVATPSPPNL